MGQKQQSLINLMILLLKTLRLFNLLLIPKSMYLSNNFYIIKYLQFPIYVHLKLNNKLKK